MGVDYNGYVALLKNCMAQKGISDADLKQYDLILQDRMQSGMYKEIGPYYTDGFQASKDNKTFLTRYINKLCA